MIKGLYSILTNKRLWNRNFICERLEARIPFLRRFNPFWAIEKAVRENTRFDASYIDKMIADAVEPYVKQLKISRPSTAQSKRVAYLVTAMSDSVGGHNKLVVNGFKLLSEDFACKLFLTRREDTERSAPKLLNDLMGYDGYNLINKTSMRDAVRLAQAIIDYNPSFLFVYAHPDDFWAITVVALLKRVANIKVMVSEHTSHYPCIGLSFGDIAFHAFMSTVYVDFKYRHNYKAVLSKSLLVCGREKWEAVIPKDNREYQRKKLGVPVDFLLTVSSGAGYKFFNEDGSSDYFTMIDNMLRENLKVMHIMRVWGNQVQMSAIRDVINKSKFRNRLILLPGTHEYEKFYDAADLYIDSIPVASAMTMVDLMRLRVPYVVFKNQDHALWTFHEYQRDDYPFIYSNSKDMLLGINRLIGDPVLRRSQVKCNYEYYMKTYEGSSSKAFLSKIIEGADNLEQFYVKPLSIQYKIKLDENGNPSFKVFGGVM